METLRNPCRCLCIKKNEAITSFFFECFKISGTN